MSNLSALKIFAYYLLSFSQLICVGNSSTEVFKSLLLVNLRNLSPGNSAITNSQRRAFIDFDDSTFESSKDEFAADPVFSVIPSSITSTFTTAVEGSVSTSKNFEDQLSSTLFNTNEVEISAFEDALEYLATNKDNLELNDGTFLSAVKSVHKAFISSQSPQPGDESPLSDREKTITEIPKVMLSTILPKVSSWGGNGPTWLKRLAQISTESLMELEVEPSLLHSNAKSFTSSVVDYVANPEKDPSSGEIFQVPGLFSQLHPVDPSRLIPKDDMRFGGLSGFDPENFAAYQQVAVGLAQGFFNSKLNGEATTTNVFTGDQFEVQLTQDDFSEFSNYDESIIKSATNGLLDGLINAGLNTEKFSSIDEISLYAYDSVKSLANGFVISSTVYGTSEPEYLANGLYLDAAELTARGVAHSAVTHEIELGVPDGQETEKIETASFNSARIAEAVANGAAMGGQLATVLPKSMEFTKNWEIFRQSRRDIAEAVSRGSSFGAVDAASVKHTNSPREVELISQRSSLGAMVGTTGMAIYYPMEEDAFQKIIEVTAKGSAYGSVNSVKLDELKEITPEEPTTESIQVALARQSAIGSTMGALFEPTVLLGLTPDTKAEDKQTIDNLSAASFGATYGAIQGIKDPDMAESSNGRSNTKDTTGVDVTEIVQSSKQGATEGALAGAKLALSLEDTSENSLNSKSILLKAINTSNAQAASDVTSPLTNPSNSLPGSPLVGNPLRTNSKDMLLLMRKFGINPRYTNAATMFKRPVVPQIDEPPVDLVSETSPAEDRNESYSESISNASPI